MISRALKNDSLVLSLRTTRNCSILRNLSSREYMVPVSYISYLYKIIELQRYQTRADNPA